MGTMEEPIPLLCCSSQVIVWVSSQLECMQSEVGGHMENAGEVLRTFYTAVVKRDLTTPRSCLADEIRPHQVIVVKAKPQIRAAHTAVLRKPNAAV